MRLLFGISSRINCPPCANKSVKSWPYSDLRRLWGVLIADSLAEWSAYIFFYRQERMHPMECMADIMRPEDWEQVRSIYLEGIGTGNATFEPDAPDWDKWDSTHLREHRLVVREGDHILAWAALSPLSSRCIYSGVAELSLYVAARHRGKGLGSALLKAIIDSTERGGIWTLQGGIFPENEASLRLVRKHGFKEVGRREKIGKMTYGELAGKWRDVILVERRSRVAGIN